MSTAPCGGWHRADGAAGGNSKSKRGEVPFPRCFSDNGTTLLLLGPGLASFYRAYFEQNFQCGVIAERLSIVYEGLIFAG